MPLPAERAVVRMHAAAKAVGFTHGISLSPVRYLAPAATVPDPEEAIDRADHAA